MINNSFLLDLMIRSRNVVFAHFHILFIFASFPADLEGVADELGNKCTVENAI